MAKIAYRVKVDAYVCGEMEVSQEVIDRIPKDLVWNDEIERLVLQDWDGANLEIDPSNDGEVEDVRVVT